ncbi:MAG: hypothetical protein UHH87_05365, partial [Akkermansia sp.]|nr:hypothetical protein [Akkermansia sp.]
VTFSENSAACYGGAITGDTAFDTVSVQLSYNDTVTFIENTAGIAGGAIDVDVLTIDHNGSVTFSENSAGSDGGAISFHDWLQITHNDSVIFSGNSGGAISGHKGSQLTIRDNGSVTFSENSVCGQFAEGGAINVWGDISLEFNDSVTFSGNSVCGQYAEGGAIYGEINGDITLWDNDSVTFSGNTARGEALNSILSGANGGAIAGDTITLRKNGSVTFSENSACGGSTSSAQGGAIAGSMITLSNNGSVTFSGNSVCGENLNTTVTYAYGGAIFANSSSSIKLSGNESVEFRENSVCGRYAQGGAIYGPGDITLNDNGSVKFSGNSASTPHSDAYANGGAIAGDTITLRNNNSVTFSENSAYCGSTSSGRGGAIMGSMITLSNNGSVTFSENSANGIIARGGAIAGNMITLSDNGNVTFSGNTATAPTSNPPNGTYGGAIYTTGDLKIRNNASVLFEKNAEIVNGIYRLRSIYASKTGDNWYSVSLSAATGKSIEFRDSVYIYDSISLVLNAEYTDTDGKTHLQTGDIIFTGATTEADLLQVKGRAGTADEVLNSRTTEIYALTMLYGGRLRVEDGAVYKGHGIRTIKDSDSTIRVKDAILDHAGYTIRLNSGTTLELEGANKITASNLEMDDGSSINFVLDSDNLNQNALTLSGNLILNGDIQIQLSGDYSLGGVYNLVSGGIISANKDCLSLPDTVDYNVVLTDSALSLVVWKDVATPETVEDWQHISSGSRITVNRDVVLCDLVANGNVYKLSGEGSLGVSEKLTVTGGADVTLELDTIAAGVELAGGTLTFRGTSLSLGAVEVSANSTLEIWDQTGSDGVAAEACSIASLDMAADLNLATTRKSKLHIATLTGEGNLTVGSSREKHEVAIADISAYDGTFTVRGGNSTLALNLGADEVLNSSRVTKDSDSALLLNGQGTYSLESLENVGADFSLASQVQFGDSWSGTLELKNGTAAGLEWNDFAAAGKVTVNGMSGWFDYFNPADIHIQLEGAGMTVLDSSKKTYKYQKGISGSGDFVVQSKSAYESWYEMRGDMEAWRGAFRVLQSAKSENAATVNLTLNGGGILFDGSEGSGVYLERTGTLNVTIGHADTASVLKGDIRNVGMTDGETTTFGSLNVTLNHEVEVQGDIQATSMKIGAGADIRTSGMVQATRCELAGGKLLHHGQNIMFGSMDVSADSVLEIVERAGNNGLAAKVCTIESLNLNAALNQIITGKCTLEIDTLTGSGPLAIQSRNEKHNVTINDISGYTGNISLSSANTTLALNLGKDVVLDSARVTKDDDSSLLLKGTGSYNIGTAREIAAGVSFAEDWQGSVRLTGTLAGDTLSSLSDEDSWVELYGVSGYLSRADATAGEQTYSANLKLTNAGSAAAWDLNNGYHQDVRIFSGAISGTGALLRSSYKGREQTLQFTGDVSGWTGELRHQPTIATYGGSVVETDVTFSGSSEINVAMTTNGLGELNVTIDDEYLAAGSQVRVNSSINATSLTVTEGTTMQLKNTATLGGNITIQATAEGSAALLSGVNVKGNMLEGMGANARLKDVWMEAVNEAYGISDVDMQNVHFSAALATLELSNVSFDESCTFTVGAEGSIVLSNAVVHIGISTTGMNGEVLTVDLSNLFQCNVQGALTLALDTDALRAAGYTAVQVDFGSDADEDYSQLSMKMNGAVYSGIDGNIAEFALVPEPATTTLSLLALTALAIRRRRAA